MPHKFADDWDIPINQTVTLTKDEIKNIIRSMKDTVADKKSSTANTICDGFDTEKGETVVIEKGMHPDKAGYMHIRVGMYGESYHLYAKFEKEKTDSNSKGWSIVIAVNLVQSRLDHSYNLKELGVKKV